MDLAKGLGVGKKAVLLPVRLQGVGEGEGRFQGPVGGAAQKGLSDALLGRVDGHDPARGEGLGALVLKVLHVKLHPVSPLYPSRDDEGLPLLDLGKDPGLVEPDQGDAESPGVLGPHLHQLHPLLGGLHQLLAQDLHGEGGLLAVLQEAYPGEGPAVLVAAGIVVEEVPHRVEGKFRKLFPALRGNQEVGGVLGGKAAGWGRDGGRLCPGGRGRQAVFKEADGLQEDLLSFLRGFSPIPLEEALEPGEGFGQVLDEVFQAPHHHLVPGSVL